jgi:hypothetical protein
MQMVGRPHTKVERSVPRLGDGWVLFPPLSDRWLRKGRTLSASDLARLDERWTALGFVGATAVVPVTEHDLDLDLGRDPDVVVCEDEDLNANVRLRLRGRLLLGDMPLIEQPEPLVGAARGVRGAERRIAAAGLLCGDERLHAAVVAGRHRRLGAPETQRPRLPRRGAPVQQGPGGPDRSADRDEVPTIICRLPADDGRGEPSPWGFVSGHAPIGERLPAGPRRVRR